MVRWCRQIVNRFLSRPTVLADPESAAGGGGPDGGVGGPGNGGGLNDDDNDIGVHDAGAGANDPVHDNSLGHNQPVPADPEVIFFPDLLFS